MDVGNDPFPREEVTGLAAFENLEPVDQLNLDPEPALESETPAPRELPSAPPPPPQRAAAEPEGAVPFGAADHPFSQHPPAPVADDERSDLTVPLLDLTDEAISGSLEEDQDQSFVGNWDDPDEATRIVTPPMAAAANAAELQMDWDEAEPPTRIREDGLLDDEIPLPPALSLPIDWDDANSATQIYDSQAHAAPTADYAGSEPEHAAPALSGGRPSPFPMAPLASSPATQTHAIGVPSPFATTAVGREPWTEGLRSGDKRTWVWAAAGALGLIVLALITRALVSGSSLGTITVATTPADARVQIDARAVSGSGSPYTLSDVSAGRHEIVVSKPGFVDYHATFVLARGEAKTLPTVELVPSVREVGFSIRSAPPGAEVWVDGRATDQLTPARVVGVSPGIHRLQLKRAGYADFELQMFVPDATVLQLPTAELLVAGSQKAAAAKVVVAHDADDSSSTSTASSAAASAAAAERRAAWKAARQAKLEARQAAAAAKAAYSPAPAARPMPASQPIGPAPSAPATGGRMGTLRVNSRPWAQVFVDGRLMGNTPQPALQLTAGNHQVKLVNQPMNLTKTFSISIKPGQMVTKVLNLVE